MTFITPDPVSLLPHGPAARFLTRVVEHGPHEIVCEGSLPANAAYEQDGRCPTYVLLELGAQAAALLELLPEVELGRGRPREGYLVRARSVRCTRLEFGAGRPLRVWARRTGVQVPLFIYELVVSDEAGELLCGELSIYAGST